MEGGYKPYQWTGLSYNEFRNVIPKRRREWEGMIVPHLEKKKPNQHFQVSKDKIGDYQDMIYTDDNQCMKSPYRTQRFDYKKTETNKGSKPNAPINVDAEATSTSTIYVSWSSVLTATYYSIYRDGSLIFQTSSTSYDDIGLDSDTKYTYSISATNSWGESGKNSASATTESSACYWNDDFETGYSEGDPLNPSRWYTFGQDVIHSESGRAVAEDYVGNAVGLCLGILSNFSLSVKFENLEVSDSYSHMGLTMRPYPRYASQGLGFGLYRTADPSSKIRYIEGFDPFYTNTGTDITRSTVWLKIEKTGLAGIFSYSLNNIDWTVLETRTVPVQWANVTIQIENTAPSGKIAVIDDFVFLSGCPALSPIVDTGTV